jgi:hypothetical protein
MDDQISNMLKVIKEAYPDYDLDMIADHEMMYYQALREITTKKDKALRYNSGKLKWSMVHFESLAPMVKVLMYGEKKYARDNWKKGLNREEILDSMQRHLASLIDGEEVDPESQEHHIGHIMCNCLFYSYFNIIDGDKSFE